MYADSCRSARAKRESIRPLRGQALDGPRYLTVAACPEGWVPAGKDLCLKAFTEMRWKGEAERACEVPAGRIEGRYPGTSNISVRT